MPLKGSHSRRSFWQNKLNLWKRQKTRGNKSDCLRAFRRLGRARQAINAVICDKAYPWSQRRCLNGAQIAEPNPNIGTSKRDQSWPRQLIPQLRTSFGTRGDGADFGHASKCAAPIGGKLERETGLLHHPLPRQNAEQNCCPRQGEWPIDERRGKRGPSHAGARHLRVGTQFFPGGCTGGAGGGQRSRYRSKDQKFPHLFITH
jgi:hypothetical protein